MNCEKISITHIFSIWIPLLRYHFDISLYWNYDYPWLKCAITTFRASIIIFIIINNDSSVMCSLFSIQLKMFAFFRTKTSTPWRAWVLLIAYCRFWRLRCERHLNARAVVHVCLFYIFRISRVHQPHPIKNDSQNEERQKLKELKQWRCARVALLICRDVAVLLNNRTPFCVHWIENGAAATQQKLTIQWIEMSMVGIVRVTRWHVDETNQEACRPFNVNAISLLVHRTFNALMCENVWKLFGRCTL